MAFGLASKEANIVKNYPKLTWIVFLFMLLNKSLSKVQTFLANLLLSIFLIWDKLATAFFPSITPTDIRYLFLFTDVLKGTAKKEN